MSFGRDRIHRDDDGDELLMRRIQRWDKLDRSAVAAAVLAEIRELLDQDPTHQESVLTNVSALVRDFETWEAIRLPAEGPASD